MASPSAPVPPAAQEAVTTGDTPEQPHEQEEEEQQEAEGKEQEQEQKDEEEEELQ